MALTCESAFGAGEIVATIMLSARIGFVAVLSASVETFQSRFRPLDLARFHQLPINQLERMLAMEASCGLHQ